jgi:hypothetical protein
MSREWCPLIYNQSSQQLEYIKYELQHNKPRKRLLKTRYFISPARAKVLQVLGLVYGYSLDNKNYRHISEPEKMV